MNGAAHRTASLALAAPSALTVYAVTGNVPASVGAAVGCFVSVFVNPDLDQEGVSSSEWTLVRRLGPIGFMWMALWWPYARAISHRSVISHAPFAGTLFRLLYIGFVAAVVCVLLGCKLEAIDIPLPITRGGIGVVGGLMISDAAHFVMDCLTVKRNREKKGVKRMIKKVLIGLALLVVVIVVAIVVFIPDDAVKGTYYSLVCQGAETEQEWYVCMEEHHRVGRK
jgi:uncharacterized metal-binding protein